MYPRWPASRQCHICQKLLVIWSVALGFLIVLGCGSSPPSDPHANQMVYYDRATKRAVVYNISRVSPALHPQTGQPTLVPALYCTECQKWFPAPPIEIRERNPKALICPKKHRLTPDGPWPEESL